MDSNLMGEGLHIYGPAIAWQTSSGETQSLRFCLQAKLFVIDRDVLSVMTLKSRSAYRSISPYWASTSQQLSKTAFIT